MPKKLRYLGLDVHAVTIAVAEFDGTLSARCSERTTEPNTATWTTPRSRGSSSWVRSFARMFVRGDMRSKTYSRGVSHTARPPKFLDRLGIAATSSHAVHFAPKPDAARLLPPTGSVRLVRVSA